MSKKLVCPFCQQKLDYDDLLCSCINEHCEESFDMVGTELLWQKVINLKQEIDSTRKALDAAVDALKIAKDCCSDYSIECLAYKALEQITALEQKD